MLLELRSTDGTRYPLNGDVIRLGRAPDNTIVLQDQAVSRYHINFFLKGNQIIAEDAGSQNGFLVNGQPATAPVILNLGDRVFVGSREYTLTDANTPSFLGAAAQSPNFSQPKAQLRQVSTRQGSGLTPLRLVAILTVLAIAGLVATDDSNHAAKRNPASVQIDLAPLPDESFIKTSPANRSEGEIRAESKYREALRDYNHGNLSRAILGFREALTLEPKHEMARDFEQLAVKDLEKELEKLLTEAQRSYANLQFTRTKARTVRILTLLSEQVPQFANQMGQEALARDPAADRSQEQILIRMPCDRTRNAEVCKKAVELLQKSRKFLGEEDVLK